MSHPSVVGAVLRIDLRGFSGDLPAALGEPARDVQGHDGTRSLFFDLSGTAAGEPAEEACRRLAQQIDRLFLAPETPPFADAFARRMKLELGIVADMSGETFSHDMPHALLDCLGAAEAELGLTYYANSEDPDATAEEI